jgi:nucleotide-binding universal stress UspA family protein
MSWNKPKGWTNMTTHSGGRPVVVGTNGSPSSMLAVRYAADQAARRGAVLRVVTAILLPGQADPCAHAGVTLRQASGLAADFLPPERITTAAVLGMAAPVLLEEAAVADLVVVGNRGFGGVRGAVLGSVGVELAADAACPVVVVRGPAESHPGAPVVVGVAGEPCGAALAAAVHMAELLGVPLHVVHAWHVPLLPAAAHRPTSTAQSSYAGPDEAALLDALLAPLLADHPDVSVVMRARSGDPTKLLVEASENAQLVVLTGHGRGEVAGLLLGSTTQDLIHQARCPVMIVPPGVPAAQY